MIRVVLPGQLKALAKIDGELKVDLPGRPTLNSLLDEIERRYPVLRGTIRDHRSAKRRPFVRYFACERDLSHVDADSLLPVDVQTGVEPLLIVGAMAGG